MPFFLTLGSSPSPKQAFIKKVNGRTKNSIDFLTMTCQVILSKPDDVFLPGTMVSGEVVCTFRDVENIRGIRVKLRGKEHTDYAKREQYFDRVENKVKYKDVHPRRCHKFLKTDYYLIGEGTLSAGRHTYPFSFTLPEDIPSSYEGTYAYIRYYVKANVDKPFAIDYKGITDFLHVHSPIDFNRMISELPLNPVTYQKQKTLGFCCCASAPITMVVRLQKRAFVEGEIATVIVDVTNNADEDVVQMMVQIVRTIRAKSNIKKIRYKKEKVIVASAVENGVRAKGQRNYEFNLTIPKSESVFNLARCKNLKQWFTLSVEAVLPNLHMNMKVTTELILGHIPLSG